MIPRSSVAFRSGFNRLVVDLFRFRNHANPRGRRIGEIRLDDPEVNAARLHTVAFSWVRDEAVSIFERPSENVDAFEALTAAFVASGDLVIEEVRAALEELEAGRSVNGYGPEDVEEIRGLLERVTANCRAFTAERQLVIDAARAGRLTFVGVMRFVLLANNFVGNVYNLGAQRGGNLEVSDRLHLNFRTDDTGSIAMTPRSATMAIGVVTRVAAGGNPIAIPVTPGGSRAIGQNSFAPFARMSPRTSAAMNVFPHEAITAREQALDAFGGFIASSHASAAPIPAVAAVPALTLPLIPDLQLPPSSWAAPVGSAERVARMGTRPRAKRPASGTTQEPEPKSMKSADFDSASSSSSAPRPPASNDWLSGQSSYDWSRAGMPRRLGDDPMPQSSEPLASRFQAEAPGASLSANSASPFENANSGVGGNPLASGPEENPLEPETAQSSGLEASAEATSAEESSAAEAILF